MAAPGNRAYILGPQFKRMGAAFAVGSDKKVCWVQDFGTLLKEDEEKPTKTTETITAAETTKITKTAAATGTVKTAETTETTKTTKTTETVATTKVTVTETKTKVNRIRKISAISKLACANSS